MEIILTGEQREILQGHICPYCHIPTIYKNSVEIYGVDYGMIYFCPKCHAYVGTYKGTNKAKGRLADFNLRKCKIKAHFYFDEIFKRGIMTRKEAYEWLSEQLSLPLEYTHIGMFRPETCAKVVEVSKKLLKTMRFSLRKQDKIKAVLSNEYLENHILPSLRAYFAKNDDEQIYTDIDAMGYYTETGNVYPLLRINDVANENAMLEFVVIGQMYDVLKLSYVGRLKE